MVSSVATRSVMFSGHKTSISLEDAFWNALKEIAATRQTPVRDLIASIDAVRESGSLSSALRLFVLHYTIDKCSQPTEEMPSMAIQSSTSAEA
jgi:predicted DNA-binding ribbon-helix-helix protein